MTACIPRLAASVVLVAATQWAWCADAPPAVIRDASGCGVVNPNPKPDESITWSGGCKDGLAEGSGLLQWRRGETPGSSYSGRLSAGKPAGEGIETFANGARYEGGFVDGRHDGHGVFTWPGGMRYDGEFQHGDMSGQGTLTLLGSRVEGTFLRGQLAGPATIVRIEAPDEIRIRLEVGTDPMPPAAAPSAVPGTYPRIADDTTCRPQYPSISLRAHAMGVTGLALLVDPDGHVQRVRLIHPAGADFAHGLLDLSALLALSRCQMSTFRVPGASAERWMKVSYRWRID